MRGGESPLDIFTPEQIIEKNLIGANSGIYYMHLVFIVL